MPDHLLASVSDNPMLGEVRRHGRRFLNHGNRTINRIALGIIGVGYVGVLMLVLSAKGDIPAIAIVALQTMLGVIMAPVSMQGIIAGEREKRTWDMLLVAPISRRDIVIGKFGASMFSFGLAVSAIVLPTILAALVSTTTHWGLLLVSEFASVSLITLVASLTLYFSSRNTRPIAALGATLATLTGTLLVVPSVIVVLLQSVVESKLLETLFYWHPLMVWIRLLGGDPNVALAIGGNTAAVILHAIVISLLYLGISAWLVRKAIRAVEKIDPEVGPVKRGRRA